MRAPPETSNEGWNSDDDYWVSAYPFLFPEHSFRKCAANVDRIIALTACSSGDLLDLCCGPGRHAIPLAKHGFRVTGVDRSAFYLEKARAYAEIEKASVSLIRENMRHFVRAQSFDLAISMTISFGYFADPADNLAVLENVHTSLKPGGTFLIEVAGKEVVAASFQEVGWQDLGGLGTVVQRRRIDDNWNRLIMDWLHITGSQCRNYRLNGWLYSGNELAALLDQAGFSQVSLYGNLDGSPYGPGAKALFAVARKDG